MKKILLLLIVAPTLALADKIDWHEGQSHIDVEDSEKVATTAPVPPKDQPSTPPSRDALYLNTLDRLKQIETINQLPATAAGDDNRACSYAKNVLLEYQLEWDHLQTKGFERAEKKQVQSQINTWQKKVGEHCH